MKYFVCLFLLWTSLQAQEKSDFAFLMGNQTKHWRYVQANQDKAFLNSAEQLYDQNRELQFTEQGPYKIPRTIHFIWLGPRAFPPNSVENVRTWIAQNPTWTVKFWTDRKREAPCAGMQVMDISDFSFGQLERCYRESENWGEKSDILRFEILMQEGGVYVDHDANCLKPFDGMHKGYDFYCCLETPHEPFVGRTVTCGNGVIGARKGHPTIARVLSLIEERWDGLKAKFRGRDPHSRAEIVMQRTYIALTDALLGTLNLSGNHDIVLPASYFFAKSGLASLYSQHFYASTWIDRQKGSEEKQMMEKMARRFTEDARRIVQYMTILILFNLFLLGFLFKFKGRLLLPLISCILLISCQKKHSVQLPSGDDFASLTGKGTSRWHYVQTKEDLAHLALFSQIYEQKKALLTTPRNSYQIPRVLHFIWLGPLPFPRASVENVRMWMAKHPDWKVYFWSDRERPVPYPGMQRRFVKDFSFMKLKEYYDASDNFGEKSDLLRYEILYQEGGIYVDHDVECFKAFDGLSQAYTFYCGIDMPYTSCLPSCIFPTNNLIGIAPGHPILKKCIALIAESWDKLTEDYPGSDSDALLNRTLHRTFRPFGEAIKMCHNQQGNQDIIFPAYYFDAPCQELALYARHTYAGVWQNNQTPFEKSTKERLMYLSKKSNKILLALGVLSGFNALLAIALFTRRRKG